MSIERQNKLTKPAVYGGLILILSLLPLLIKAPFYLHILIITFVYIIATVSLRTIAISGQISLAHAAFMGLGAYTASILSKWVGLTPWVSILVGGGVALVVGTFMSYVFVRLRALLFSMLTLFFGMALYYVNQTFVKWTGGSSGLIGIPPLFGASKVPYYYFFLGLTVLSLLALYRFEFSRIGTTLKAIAESYLVAGSVGINEAKYRIIVVAVGCFFVGITGASYAHYMLVVAPSSFGVLASINLIVYMIIGGRKSFAGPIIGSAFLILIPEFFHGLRQYVPFLSAGILVIVLFILPEGLVALPQVVRSWFIRRKSKTATYESVN
jgi:branched-chain amino acid transport system permease protein